MAAEARIATTSSIEVAPAKALIDERVSIRVRGLEPAQPVVLRAHMRDDFGGAWASHASFQADPTGAVDASIQAALSGTYQGLDPMGLFWSMTPQDELQAASWLMQGSLASNVVTLTAEVDGEAVESATVERTHLAPGLWSIPIREQGLVGTLFRRDDGAPHPAVIVLVGSIGGLRESPAALLASHGYAAFALAYFGVEGLPQDLVRIPLEYFETAIGWLLVQEGVASDRLAVVGESRGGELALLLGATFPQIGAVVGMAPSAVMLPGFRSRLVEMAALLKMVIRRPPGWTYRGAPLPSLVPGASLSSIVSYGWKRLRRAPIAATPFFLEAMEDRDAVERAAIPVERIKAPVLLLSGQDDQFFPSALSAASAIERLARHRHPYPYEHVAYPGAGHLFLGMANQPATVTKGRHPATGAVYLTGGNAKDNAFAAADSWRRVLAFLEESFGRAG